MEKLNSLKKNRMTQVVLRSDITGLAWHIKPKAGDLSVTKVAEFSDQTRLLTDDEIDSQLR